MVTLDPNVRVQLNRVYGTRKQPTRFYDNLRITARKRVCRHCNSGWMSQVQENAISAVGAMLANLSPLVLAPEGQDATAGWLTMTAMVMEAEAESGFYYTQLERDRLRLHHEIPALTTVWLGQRAEASPLAAFALGIPLEIAKPPGGSNHPAFVLTLSIGYAIFQMLVTRLRPDPPNHLPLVPRIEETWNEQTVRFGPPTGPLLWPPQRPMDESTLRSFAHRWQSQQP